MKHQLEQRLKELKAEFESGQKALAELENRQADLRNTLMRISGAIQVLEEELRKSEGDSTEPLPVPEEPAQSEPVEAEALSDTG